MSLTLQHGDALLPRFMPEGVGGGGARGGGEGGGGQLPPADAAELHSEPTS